MDFSAVEKAIQDAIPDAEVRVADLGGGDHLGIIVVAEAFRDQKLLSQHRMVMGALEQALSGPVHAVQIKTYTPERDPARGGK